MNLELPLHVISHIECKQNEYESNIAFYWGFCTYTLLVLMIFYRDGYRTKLNIHKYIHTYIRRCFLRMKSKTERRNGKVEVKKIL